MYKPTKYRIVQESGAIYIQQLTGFFWKSWETIMAPQFGSGEGDYTYRLYFNSMELAKADITERLAKEAIENEPRIITSYPN